ncbi:hypothetical protein O4H61_03755 [Roseovarius aestuarii]|nr:hypothetical protein [Roseovarius aestuarii]
MAIKVTTQLRAGQEPRVQQSASHLSLSAPTDVFLGPGTASVSATEKLGSDLLVRFSDGETLHIADFFVAGEKGDFSTLVYASGEVALSGLMGPEPFQSDIETSEAVSDVEPAVSRAEASPDDTSGLLGAGAGWTALGAGAIAVGSGISFLSESDDTQEGTAPSTETDLPNDEAKNDLAAAIDEFVGSDTAALTESDYDADGVSADAQRSIDPEQSLGANDGSLTGREGFVETELTDVGFAPFQDDPLLNLLDLTAETF